MHKEVGIVENVSRKWVSTNANPRVSYNGNSGNKGKERPICTHCGNSGHTVDKCYKLHGFPLGFQFKGKNPMANQVSSP